MVPFTKSLFDKWGVRFTIPFVLVGATLFLCGLLQVDGAWVLYSITLVLTLQLLAVERLRTGGSWLSSGLWLTPSLPRMVLIGLVGGIGSIASLAGVAFALGATLHFNGSGGTVMAVFTLVIASILEELFFRGTIFEAIRERYGNYVAVGVTSVLFGLAHLFNNGASFVAITNVVLAGMLFGALTVYSGSLWPAMIFHALWNVLVRAFFGTVSGAGDAGWIATLDVAGVAESSRWFITGPFGIEQGISTTLVLCTAIVAAVAFVRPDGTVRAARFRRDHFDSQHVRHV